MVAYAEFATPKLVAISESGHAHLYTVTSGSTTDVSTLGTGFPPIASCPMFVSGTTPLLIVPASNGTTGPKKYDGSSVASLGGSPPAGKYACSYKNRLYLAATSANPNRLYASKLGDGEVWDTAVGWIDFDDPIKAIAPLPNAMVVLSERQAVRLVGSNPPPGGDMEQQPLSLINGTPDARSVCVWNGQVIFCNPRGVYMTPGAGITNLTRKGGIESYWQSLLSSYTTSWVISAGVFRDFLFVNVMNGTTLIDQLVCDLTRTAWARWSNVKAGAFAPAVGVADELWYADRSTNRLTKLAGCFAPVAGNKNDANGTAVAPVLQLRPFMPSATLNHYDFGWVSLDMRDAASDNPTMAVQIAPGLEAETFSAVPESPFSETTLETRQRFDCAVESQALSVKFTQTNASSQTEIHGVQLRVRPQAQVLGGQ
jgi:hypothetical protein